MYAYLLCKLMRNCLSDEWFLSRPCNSDTLPLINALRNVEYSVSLTRDKRAHH